MQVLVLLFQLVVFAYEVRGKKTGAPSSACDSMTPNHYATTGREDTPMFSLSVSSSTYTPGSTLTVTLRRQGSGTFKGFLVEARTADPTKDQLVRYGQFVAGLDARTICSGDAITHVINNIKTEVTFNWTAPSTGEGDIEFRTTYVEQFTSYWIGVKSTVIQPSSSTTSSTKTSPSTTQATATPLPTTPPSTTLMTLLSMTQTMMEKTSQPSGTDTSTDTSTKAIVGDGGGANDVRPAVCFIVLQFVLVISLGRF